MICIFNVGHITPVSASLGAPTQYAHCSAVVNVVYYCLFILVDLYCKYCKYY